MNEKRAIFLVDGTAALDPGFASISQKRMATIIPFPERKSSSRGARCEGAAASAQPSIRKRVLDVLLASEMYCSLMFEDVRGCRYGKFTPTAISVLSASSAVVAALALFFGA